jgi:hypothetical protein
LADRCRLCTANDRDALIDQVAERMWERQRHGSPSDWPWAEAGPYWRPIYIELAATAVELLDETPGS